MMKTYISITSFVLLASCASDKSDIANALPDIKNNSAEIRLVNLPDLAETQCNRGLYAWFRTESAESVRVTLDIDVVSPTTSPQTVRREIVLSPMPQTGWLGGETSFLPKSIEAPCEDVHVRMTKLSCTFDNEDQTLPCPQNIRWNKLQGFKMIEIPKQK